jgi:hypothetical protein
MQVYSTVEIANLFGQSILSSADGQKTAVRFNKKKVILYYREM